MLIIQIIHDCFSRYKYLLMNHFNWINCQTDFINNLNTHTKKDFYNNKKAFFNPLLWFQISTWCRNKFSNSLYKLLTQVLIRTTLVMFNIKYWTEVERQMMNSSQLSLVWYVIRSNHCGKELWTKFCNRARILRLSS